jgi:hypothetical protein
VQDDVVALFDPGDLGPDLDHDAGAFVARDDRSGEGDVAGDEVVVGVAEPGRGELDQDLALLRGVELDLLDLVRLVDSVEDGGLDLHVLLLRRVGQSLTTTLFCSV